MESLTCTGVRLGDLQSSCAREFWASAVPAILVVFLCVGHIPLPSFLRKPLGYVFDPFRTFLTVPEAEALDAQAAGANLPSTDARGKSVSIWRTFLMSSSSMTLALLWLAVGTFRAFSRGESAWYGASAFLSAFAWLYAAMRPIVKPKATPHYELFALFCFQWLASAFVLGDAIYDNRVSGTPMPVLETTVQSIDFAIVTFLVAAQLFTPLAIPSSRIDPTQLGLTEAAEDFVTLLDWLTFRWVWPLVRRGTSVTLNEPDIPKLSITNQTRPLFIKFASIKRKTILRRLWNANSLDVLLDFLLTVVTVVFEFSGPFFLKKILYSIEHPEIPGSRAQAYIYTFLAFFASLLKSVIEAQHLWFGRRVSIRVRSELMVAIYDKALKRKDFSGVVDKEKAKELKEAKDSKGKANSTDKEAKKKDDGDEPKAGADVGKIVNLMSGDASRCSMSIGACTFLYAAPFEILLGSIQLYQLLGWSAFAGFLVMVVGWPLNSVISRRSLRIQKGTLAARDKRMGVLNELISAVKFIKFFAWEDQWIKRALEARKIEVGWLIKSRINFVMFSLYWNAAPFLVSIVSFAVYIYTGHELSVSTAFASIALFSMIRQPLNVLPTWIIQLLQTYVALKRIGVYLDEDEVTEQVSSLKRTSSPSSEDNVEKGLGIERGTFKWNEVEETKPEADAKAKGKQPKSPAPSSHSDDTAVDNASLNSNSDEREFELKDIDVRFPEGVLTLVTGPTASGKTALLMALLGEMTTTNGRIVMLKDPSRVDANGLMHSISYAAQTPWLRHQSIKDNILFGAPFDEERYNQVIECCALATDLDILEDGDATEIGARGVSLSGGQKARVALARAVYARTKYVLLDDPLSAVDSHTARVLFDKLLCGPLLANRTVVLVTHHVELVLPGAHYLVRMLDGRIDTQGKITDLRADGVLEAITHDAVTEAEEERKDASEEAAFKEAPVEAETTAEGEDDTAKKAPKKPRQLVQDEAREEGSVKWNIYKTYLRASSYWTWAILFALIIVIQIANLGEKLWIKTWGEAYGETGDTEALYEYRSASSHGQEILNPAVLSIHHVASYTPRAYATAQVQLPDVYEHPMFYVVVYAVIGLGISLIGVVSSAVQYTGAIRASRLLFKQLLVAVVRATMRWHDTTPQGRMLNRFSKDIETIDSSLASSLHAVNSSFAAFLASTLIVSVVFPTFIIPAVLLGLVYRYLAIGYLNTGRDLRRMESNTRSPIFSGFGELLEGIVTVRAFSAEARFLDGLYGKVDLTTQMHYSFWMTNRWLLINFDVLGAVAVLITTLLALAGYVSAGTAGLCITSAMAFTMSVYWTCRFWTNLELDLNSVERVVEYLDLPQEPPAVIESNQPPAYWPSHSSNQPLLSIEDLTVKYAPDLPAVLHNISFSLKSRERIGLLGRTGSGKSTLAMSILRFVDPVNGKIVIDGIDISKIGLYDLRSRLTFIPQDATLFSGSLRENLDPFDEHTDDECLDVLHRVQMITDNAFRSQRSSREGSRAPSIHDASSATEVGSVSPPVSLTSTEVDAKATVTLDTQVSPGGANFSQGQRQLIAMARALLRRSPIIILDEATSSIDFATDAKIQQTIREEFTDSLLLTVAHRLRTVIDYDRLIVLDKGTVAEFDTPYNLIRKDGIFRNMCLKSGTFSELEAAAKAKAEEVSGQ